MVTALVVAGSSIPVAADSYGVPEGFDVGTVTLVTGVPAAITYEAPGGGPLAPGMVSDIVGLPFTVTSNDDIAVTLAAAGFAGTPALPASIREGQIVTGGMVLANGYNAPDWTATGTSWFDGTVPILSAVAPVNASGGFNLKVTIPALTPPGSWSSTVTLDVSVPV